MGSMERFANSGVFSEPLIAEPSCTVRTAQLLKNEPYVTQAAADEQLERWIQDSIKDCCPNNATKTIISLFDESGVWSAPYVRAGYDVIQLDLQNGVDISELTAELMHGGCIDEVYGVLAACPCTHFANSGARWFAGKDAAGITLEGIDLVHIVMEIIEYYEPVFWALENPEGRIRKLCGLPAPRLRFHPNHFGDPYEKKTQLFGRFNPDLPMCHVEATEGSRAHKLRGDVPEQKKLRSLTPEGFAYAFYRANRNQSCAEVVAGVNSEEYFSNCYENKIMKDEHDTQTADILEKTKPKKRGPGRKPLMATAMQPRERVQKQRFFDDETIKKDIPNLWNERQCVMILGNSKKYSRYQERAWKRYGELKGYIETGNNP